MKYQGIIFDFNGTLFFDNDKHVKAWNEISKILRGKEITLEELHTKLNGTPNIQNILYFTDGKATKEELEKYRINREAIIVNIGENVKYDEPCFDGVNINYFKISCPDEYLERFEQVGSQFDLAQMYESILLQDRVDKTKLEAVYSRIKEDNIKIVELIGNNGPISDQELQKIHIQNLDKMRKLV